jgi:pentatricopeptide repeat protein
MAAAGMPPDCTTLNELLELIIKKGIADAWSLIDEMQVAGVQPNRATCTILLKGVQARSKSADVERAINFSNGVDDLDEALFTALVEACIRAGRGDLLAQVLKRQRMPQKGNPRGTAHRYASMIRAYGYVKDVPSVWETWREMRTRHIAPSSIVLGTTVEALAQNGEVEAGYELINEMWQIEGWAPVMNAVVYCSILKGFSHQKRFDRMWTVYQEMLSHSLKFSIITFNTLIDACARNGQMFRIPPLLEDMVDQGIPPNIITYGAIMKGYCMENQIEEAFSVVEGMMRTTSFKPDEVMYNTLLDGCARKGMYDRGMQVLQDMIHQNISPTNYTLSVVVKLAGRSKQPDRAFELCDEIVAKFRIRKNVHVYSNLVQVCLQIYDLDRGMALLVQMLSDGVRPDMRMYSLLMKGYLADCKASDATGLLRAAVGLPDVHPKLCKFSARSLQTEKGLAESLITEVVEGIAACTKDEKAAVALVKDLRSVPGIKVDPKLQLRLANSALKGK